MKKKTIKRSTQTFRMETNVEGLLKILSKNFYEKEDGLSVNCS